MEKLAWGQVLNTQVRGGSALVMNIGGSGGLLPSRVPFFPHSQPWWPCHLLIWQQGNLMRNVSRFCLLQEKVESGSGFVLDYCSSCTDAQSCPTLCHPMNRNTPGFPVLHYLLAFAQIHVHWVSDAIQPSHPLSPPLGGYIKISMSNVTIEQAQ